MVNKTLSCIFILLVPFFIQAETTWKLVPTKSIISFSATQNNAPVTGQFKSFTSELSFDPAKLNKSHVIVTVQTNSIVMSYKEVRDFLLSDAWFNVKVFPTAVFKSTSFTKLSDNNYQVKGELTIRDKTVPTTVNFMATETANGLSFKGNSSLKRTQFGIGQGDWAKTDLVKDEVQVQFELMYSKA